MAKTHTNTSPQEMNYSPVQSESFTKTSLRSVKAFDSDLDYIQMELDWLKLRCERFYYRNDEGQLNQRNRWHQDEDDHISPEMIQRRHDLKLKSELKLRAEINKRLAAHRLKGSFTLSLDALSERCGLNDFHRTVLLIIAAPSFSSEFEKAFGRLMSQDHDHCPDVEMIFRFFELSFTERIDYRREFGQRGQLIIHDLMQVDMHRRYRAVKDLLNANLEIDSRTFTYMIGRNDLSDEFLEFSSVDEPLASFEQVVLPLEDKRQILSVVDRHERYLEARSRWGFDERISYGKGSMMLFYGPPGTGKTMTAHAIAQHLGKRVFNVDIPTFISHSDADRFLPGLFREARLQNAVLFFDECEILFADRRRGSSLTTLLLTELERFEGVAIFATNLPEVLDEAFQRRVLVRLAFAEPDASNRAEIWRSLMPPEAPVSEDVDYEVLGARYEITGGYIKNAILAAVATAVHKSDEDAEALIMMDYLEEAARQQMKQIGSDPEMVVPDVRLKDVILEPSAEDQVRRLIGAVRHLPSVLRRWKIGGVGGDRGGVVGLLHGLPGTGKTLCAESIAGELNRPLMVARSSTILSKWVGESERNLQSLFKEAKANGAVLFIDEADSMIGQRDKSNSEHSRSLINLLLSLIERHSGVVLLATNFRDGLDSALERRITHQVELKRPTAEMRRRIWELMLSEETLGVQELKLDELSARYELSGAEIRVVLLRAATAAFEEGESGLTQALLEREAAQLLGAQQKSKSIGFGVSRGA